MVFHLCLSNSKSPWVSRILHNILADFSNAVIWMVLACPPIFNSSIPLYKPLGTIPIVPFTIGITVTFMFHIFLSSSSRVQVFVFLYAVFDFSLWDGKVHDTVTSLLFFFFFFFFFLLIITCSGLLAGIKLSVSILKSERILCVSSSRTDSNLWKYHLIVLLLLCLFLFYFTYLRVLHTSVSRLFTTGV